MIKRIICLMLATVLMLSLGACKEENKSNDPNEYRIFTSFYPVYVATLNITDGAKNVTLFNLTDSSIGCMHDYTMTTDDRDKMKGSDLFIASGMGMESFVGKSSLGIPRMEFLDCGEDIEHIIEYEDETQNSHYWLNIDNTIGQAEKIKRTLVRLNPQNAEVYEANAKAYTEKLIKLREDTAATLLKLPDKKVAVYHDSFEYFAEEFGVETFIIPSDGKLSEAVALFKAKGFKKILVQQSLLETERFELFCEKTGAVPVVVDTVTSGSAAGDVKEAYFNAISRNVAALKEITNE